jgi:hypothetical protein
MEKHIVPYMPIKGEKASTGLYKPLKPLQPVFFSFHRSRVWGLKMDVSDARLQYRDRRVDRDRNE